MWGNACLQLTTTMFEHPDRIFYALPLIRNNVLLLGYRKQITLVGIFSENLKI